MEDLYSEVHEAIRADPAAKTKERTKPASGTKKWQQRKLTYEERKEKLKAKLAELTADE